MSSAIFCEYDINYDDFDSEDYSSLYTWAEPDSEDDDTDTNLYY